MKLGMISRRGRFIATGWGLARQAMPLALLGAIAAAAGAQPGEMRQWVDSTGTFKVHAALVEVRGDVALLKSPDGKTLSIPLSRLSSADQEFLRGDASPFQEVSPTATPQAAPGGAPSGTNPGAIWDDPKTIDWDQVPALDPAAASATWRLELPAQTQPLLSNPKRASLTSPADFHERFVGLEVNARARRAVACFRIDRVLAEQHTRISLLDVSSGKSLHGGAVPGNMSPLAILDEGLTVLMQGAGRDENDSPDELQLWRIVGKKIVRSQTWIPFQSDVQRFGRTENAKVVQAGSLPNHRLVLLGDHGRLACVDAVTREAYWHGTFEGHCAMDVSPDGNLLAVVHGPDVFVLDPQAGEINAAKKLEGDYNVGFTQIEWSPSGERLLVGFGEEHRLLDVKTGEWTHEFRADWSNKKDWLDYVHDDYVLVGDRVLIHIPSGIKVCEYLDATQVAAGGGYAFIGLQLMEGGGVAPVKLPHEAAAELAQTAAKDPSVFLVHPGVEVAIDADGAGQYSQEASENLRLAAEKAGYKVVPSAPISLKAIVSGPTQKEVRYLGHGTLQAGLYEMKVLLVHEGKEIWSRGTGLGAPVLARERGESIEEALIEATKKPQLKYFESVDLPKVLQKPSGNATASTAMMVTRVTRKGLEDVK